MELRGSEDIHQSVGESPETPTSPALPSKKDVILIALFFLLVTFGFQNILGVRLSRFFYDLSHLDENAIRLITKSNIAAWYLNLIDGRAALITSVLLYFGVARRASQRERRRRRGEIFTGLVNLHIFLLAVAMLFASLSWGEISEVYLGGILVSFVVSTALWCTVGFHLCEGRYLLPLGGVFLWNLFAGMLSVTWGWWPLPLAAGLVYLVGPILGLLWQVGTLIRAGSGFDLFPTGLWPAIKRCAPVLVPIAVCFWLLSQIPCSLVAGYGSLLFMTGISLWLGGVIDLPIAYLVPIFLLGWEGEGFERRSRKLTYVLLGVGILLLLLCVPVMLLDPHSLPWHLFLLSGETGTIVIFPFWSVLVPLSIYRWWVRGGFVRPVGIAAVGPAIFGLLILALATEDELVGFAFGASRVVTILLVAVFLFRRIPPRGGFSSPTVREGPP